MKTRRAIVVVTSQPQVQVKTEQVIDERLPSPPPSFERPAHPKHRSSDNKTRLKEPSPGPDDVRPVEGPTGVAAFFASLRPSQLSRLPLFESLGVTTLEELHGLAHMTEKSLEAFLARAVRGGSIWLGLGFR
jgi:hypothetical protein